MERETFLTPGKWAYGDWPSLDLVKSNLKGLVQQENPSGLTAKPMIDFLSIWDADLSNYNLPNEGKDINLKASSVDLSHPADSPTFIGKR